MKFKSYLITLLSYALVSTTHASPVSSSENTLYGYIENKGQIHDQNGNARNDVRYIYVDETFKVILRNDGFSYEWLQANYVSGNNSEAGIIDLPDDEDARQDYPLQFITNRVDIDFVNANNNIEIVSEGQSPFYTNYFNQYTGYEGIKRVRSYEKVIYRNVYNGIDLEFCSVKGNDGKNYPEYSFVVHPEGNMNNIALSYKGMNQLSVMADGSLQLNVALGFAKESLPVILFSDGSSSKEGSFIQHGSIVSFKKVKHKAGQTIIIDPTIQWSTYWGGNGKDLTDEIATDSYGNCYVTGRTRSSFNVATSGAYQTVNAGSLDIPLMKWSPAGSLLYSTFYGGEDNEIGFAICVDPSDQVWVGGHTFSVAGIATPDAEVSTFAGPEYDGVLSKWSPDGDLLYGTYYGGTGEDEIQELATDNEGNIYASGFAESLTGIIFTTGYKMVGDTMGEGTLAKYDGVTGHQVWCTYWGGDKRDRGHGICVYKNNVYWGVTVVSTNGIIYGNNVFQSSYGGGDGDIMISRWDKNTGNPIWSTYFGGIGGERCRDFRTDRDGNLYLTGQTETETGLATAGTWETSFNYSLKLREGIVAKFDSLGNRIWATYFGGNDIDMPRSLRVLPEGAPIYVGGYTKSDSGFVTSDAYDQENKKYNDAFWLRFNHDGTVLQYSTYFGGEKQESITEAGWYGPTLELDAWNNVYLSSGTNSVDGIAVNAYKDVLAADDQYDFFVSKFSDPCPDGFEPNGDFTTATLLDFRGSNSITWYAPLQVKNDKDYYTFTTTAGQSNLKITLTNLPYDANLFVYDNNNNLIASSQHSGLVKESVTLNNTYIGKYSVLVKSPTQEWRAGVCYTLTVNANSFPFREEDEIIKSLQGSISLYPNPANQNAELQFACIEDGEYDIMICDVQGKVLIPVKESLAAGDQIISLPIENLTDGTYFVKITGAGINDFVKLVIQK